LCASGVPHIVEKTLTKIQLCFRLHLNLRFAPKVMNLQSRKSPNFGNFETPNLGIPKQNDIWMQGPWPGTKNNIKGKVVASFKFGSWGVRGSSVHQKCSNYALTNLLFGLFRFMWIIDPLVIHLNPHPRAPAHPSTFKVLRIKERTPTFYPFVVFTLDLQLKLSKSLGVH
jgi:hypothetical protein